MVVSYFLTDLRKALSMLTPSAKTKVSIRQARKGVYAYALYNVQIGRGAIPVRLPSRRCYTSGCKPEALCVICSMGGIYLSSIILVGLVDSGKVIL